MLLLTEDVFLLVAEGRGQNSLVLTSPSLSVTRSLTPVLRIGIDFDGCYTVFKGSLEGS